MFNVHCCFRDELTAGSAVTRADPLPCSSLTSAAARSASAQPPASAFPSASCHLSRSWDVQYTAQCVPVLSVCSREGPSSPLSAPSPCKGNVARQQGRLYLLVQRLSGPQEPGPQRHLRCGLSSWITQQSQPLGLLFCILRRELCQRQLHRGGGVGLLASPSESPGPRVA